MALKTASESNDVHSYLSSIAGGSGYPLADMAGFAAVEVAIPIWCGIASTTVSAASAVGVVRLPFAIKVTDVKGHVAVGTSGGGGITVDVNDSGTTILSTKLTIDQAEKTSETAAAAEVISDTVIAANAEITVDVDSVGDANAKGLVVWLIGYKTAPSAVFAP